MRTSPFTMITIDKAHQDNLKTAFFYDFNGIQGYTTFIPWDYDRVQIVHFVSGNNGDEYGQFVTIEEAITKARFMASVPVEERRQYDQ